MPGTFYRRPNNDLYVVGPYGKIYETGEIETWSWSDTEPEQEMLMVKPHGIFCAHWWNEIGHLLNIVADLNVKTFCELGILDGGLTALFLDRARMFFDFNYLGINLGLQYTDMRVIGLADGVNFQGRFVLADMDLWQPRAVAAVSSFVRQCSGRAMVYCDGGDKIKEAHLYWPVLRPGDLLGVHDYSDDPDSVGPEVYFSDVSDIIRAGKRLGQDDLKETRILLIEKV